MNDLYFSPNSFIKKRPLNPIGNAVDFAKLFHNVSNPNNNKKTIDIQCPHVSSHLGARVCIKPLPITKHKAITIMPCPNENKKPAYFDKNASSFTVRVMESMVDK